ncbi:MAG: glycerol-3-phosphate 1-O-acyltransferase PlsY [Deltaproteobacteria bacterium]|nr:glycerol-3-phosphate 1-O-acyltransferase PlsY [Deltaproteobacteria bacterium]
MPEQYLEAMVLLIFAYLLGSIPFGLVLARIFVRVDLRSLGSGNIGATNAKRAGGWGLGLATLAADMAKGAAPVWIASILYNNTGSGEIICALAAISAFLGHLYPVYLGFRTGGKGVAIAAGAFAVISPAALLTSLAGFFVPVLIFRRVSAGSLAAAVILPAAVFFTCQPRAFFICALVISAFIIWRHRENIRRLIEGKEPPLW